MYATPLHCGNLLREYPGSVIRGYELRCLLNVSSLLQGRCWWRQYLVQNACMRDVGASSKCPFTEELHWYTPGYLANHPPSFHDIFEDRRPLPPHTPRGARC
jgi:hypothetical protein